MLSEVFELFVQIISYFLVNLVWLDLIVALKISFIQSIKFSLSNMMILCLLTKPPDSIIYLIFLVIECLYFIFHRYLKMIYHYLRIMHVPTIYRFFPWLNPFLFEARLSIYSGLLLFLLNAF